MFCTDLEDKFMNDEIMVSICCLVFNHEKYLRKCLDGFVNQKTNGNKIKGSWAKRKRLL